MAQRMIAEGLPLVIVMPGVIFGPGDTSISQINIVDCLEGLLPVVPAPTAYSWGYVDVIAYGHLLAMEEGKIDESYRITGETHTLAEAFYLAKGTSGIAAPLTLPVGVIYTGENGKGRRELGYSPRPFEAAWEATLCRRNVFA